MSVAIECRKRWHDPRFPIPLSFTYPRTRSVRPSPFIGPPNLVRKRASSLTTAPHDPKFEALCSAVFKFIVAASPPGAAATRLMAQAKKGRTIISQAIAHLEETHHIEGRDERRGRTSGTFYYPAEGATEYTPAIASNGLGIEPTNTSTNKNGKIDLTDADAFIYGT
jgi:hypothetical protein